MNKTQAKKDTEKEFDDYFALIRSNFDEDVLHRAVRELQIESELGDWWSDYYAAGEPDDRYAFLKQWLSEKGYDSDTLISQWKSENPSINTADKYINAMAAAQGYRNLAEWRAASVSAVDEDFAAATYDYQITTDDALLVQVKLPANKGSNELSGKTFDYKGYNGYREYTFTASDYTSKDAYNDQTTTDTGTYAYDSSAKRVWLRPEKVYEWSSSELLTMLEYYESGAYGDNTADSKASITNSAFRVERERYGLTPVCWIGYYDDYGRRSIRLNRSMPDTRETTSSKPKAANQE